jgi:hypothetical protein
LLLAHESTLDVVATTVRVTLVVIFLLGVTLGGAQ